VFMGVFHHCVKQYESGDRRQGTRPETIFATGCSPLPCSAL
jgi:hypothetical protein